MSAQPPIGIDLGTTYSAVAKLGEDGKPVTLSNSTGEYLTPTALLFEDGEVVVGREASRASVISPQLYADCFKRDMGSPEFRRQVNSLQPPPEVLSAFVLERLKQDAEQQVGPVTQAVITVPAFFDENRRRATLEAGKLAGLEVLEIINEPTAAAIAYGFQQGFSTDEATPAESRKVLVYDLGGGTFDVTVLEIQGRRFRAIATDGDVLLGGKDFDQRIVNYLAEQFIEEHGVDPRTSLEDAAQLWLDAESYKQTLSERVKVNAVFAFNGLRMRRELTRSLMEELTRDLLERTEITVSLVIKDAGLSWDDIDCILLVGGSSRMPMVPEMLTRVSGRSPDRSVSPDQAVAHGAALRAGMLMGTNESENACELVNVNSHTLGVVGFDPSTKLRVVAPLIPKNTPLPHRAAKTFRTAKANQRNVMVSVVEGESTRPEHCIALGECIIRDLPANLPAKTKVQVEYRYDESGRISIRARIPTARQSAQVEIDRGQKDLQDLDSWRRRLFGEQTELESQDNAESPVAQLDDLLVKAGRAALKQNPDAQLQAEWNAAASAMRSLQEVQGSWEAANARLAALAERPSVSESAQLASLEQTVREQRQQARFACLVLGRECANRSALPPEAAGLLTEIRRLQEKLS